MNAIRQLTIIAGLAALLPLATQAGENGTAYTQLGTNGLGLGYAASVSPNWALRGQLNYLPKQKFSGDVGDFGSGSNLTVEVDWNSVMLVGDWYPLGEGFRVSAGALANNNKITVSGTGQVNGKTATVNAEAKMSDGITPYLGIGYGIKPKMDKGLGFNMDFGVMFQNPKSTLTATGAGVTQADVDAQNQKVQDAINNLKYFPLLSFGISYSF
ncbi:hypothetical protein RQP54_19510 [Curvibacter sp. APW13]|uniref:hypothetical protein n=1 Tax=Curvibacter sp. APW13 TaxID=3077236 RepID=UPI0028DF1817|nr:hypothetical protein [Curvibacter sp. APW13]MDT8993070.1 hypothetical protein [Curvibacter sp. APW13]